MSSPIAGNPPPDLSGYVDLRIYDVTDQEMVETARASLELNIPELTLREGHTETLLLEAIALENAELIVAINRLPGAVVEAILQIASVTKDYGGPAFATATITAGDTAGHTIPAGTRLYLPLSDGSAVTFLIEPPDGIIDVGNSTVTVSLISAENTSAANGVPIGTPLELADPVPFIDSIVLASAVVDGRDPEEDDEWRDRGVARLSRLSDALVVPRHFEAAALEDPAVGRALAIDVWDPAGGGNPGDNPGHITVCVLGDDGNPLSAPAKTALEASMEERAVATLDVHVVDALIDAIDVSVEFTLLAGFDSATIIDAVEEAVTLYLDPLTWQWGDVVRLNEIISLVDRVDGVDHVLTVLINAAAADHTLSSARALPKADTITAVVS